MAEMTFTCPHCQQGIQCDTQWASQQLQCPTCQGLVQVPKPAAGNPLVPKVPTGPSPRLSIGASKASTSEAPKSLPPSLQKPRRAVSKRKFEVKSLLPILGIVIILGAAAFFGWPYVVKMQDKANAASAEAAKNSDGGEVGHIMATHAALDATDPDKLGRSESGQEGLPNRQSTGTRAIASGSEAVGAVEGASGGEPGRTEKALPIVPPVHTLVVAGAKIPASRVNGTISGTNFVSEAARLDQVGYSKVLRFMQGTPTSPDREILVYLRLKPTDSLSNYVVEVSSEQRGTALPTIVKRWKNNPRYAAQSRTFNSGYALKLELKQNEDGSAASGKVFVALPDNEQTVIAGNFTATVNLAGAGTGVPVAAPTATAPTGGMSAEERQVMQQRYGIQ